jgi:hypothetical protein
MAGCRNHGCLVETPKGMATNGRCTCFDKLDHETMRIVMRKLIILRRIEKRIGNIVDIVGDVLEQKKGTMLTDSVIKKIQGKIDDNFYL